MGTTNGIPRDYVSLIHLQNFIIYINGIVLFVTKTSIEIKSRYYKHFNIVKNVNEMISY